MLHGMDDATRAMRILRQHVQTDALLGVEAVPVGTPPEVTLPKPDAKPQAAAARAPVVFDGDKAEALAAIDDNEVKACTQCVLCEGRTQTVFGDGNADADLMFIGEGPGQREDEQGIPFVGRAGELLAKMIAAMGFDRQDVYIANVVKCRPPNNRAPLPDEVAACSGYLHRQIAIIQPKVIVTLGGPATKLMLDTKQGITRIRGTWHQYTPPASIGGEPIPVMPTFHPAFLLRQYTTDNRKKVWSDLQDVMTKLG